MNKDLNECLKIAIYQEAAQRICQELDARGFTTENPNMAENLDFRIAEIVQETIEGNVNYSDARECEPSEAEIEELLCEIKRECKDPGCKCHEDGWEGDLQNQM